jgi:hypothetical protein
MFNVRLDGDEYRDYLIIMSQTNRYYLSIKTGPEQQWMQPMGWTADTLEAAREMLRKADRLWMAVRVTDSVTGEIISE